MKLKDGDRIRLDIPVKFTDHTTFSEFTVKFTKRYGRNQMLYQADNGLYYRIPNIKHRKLTVVSEAQA